MIKILLGGIYYPMAMLRYFELALEYMEGVRLCRIGVDTGNWIPWDGGMTLPLKYAKPPDIALDRSYIHKGWSSLRPYVNAIEKCLDGSPDIFIQVDAGFHFKDSPYKTIGVATDPHCLNYDPLRAQVSTLYNMQEVYKKDGDVYLPYAYSEHVHYPEIIEKEYDAALIGLKYGSRVRAYTDLVSSGKSVYFNLGDVFDGYRQKMCSAKSVINISSLNDLNARMFEIPAMGVPLIANTVADTPKFFEEYVDYYPVKSHDDVVRAVDWVLENPDQAADMAYNASESVSGHTYTNRCVSILENEL